MTKFIIYLKKATNNSILPIGSDIHMFSDTILIPKILTKQQAYKYNISANDFRKNCFVDTPENRQLIIFQLSKNGIAKNDIVHAFDEFDNQRNKNLLKW